MTTRILIILLLLSKLSSGQFADRIVNYCKDNQFDKLIILIDSLHETGGRTSVNYRAYQEINRQIISSYYETILYYEENQTSFLDYTIQLISDSNNIIYCKIFSVKFVDKPEIIYNFLNEKKFSTLQYLYYKTYENKINVKDFFVDKVVYGTRCSKGASPPEYRQICEKAVQKKNISLLNKWLTSVTTEKQMYAVDALSRLENDGYILTVKQKTLIDIIKNKKGTVRCCSGCLFSSWDIKDAWKLELKQ